MGSSQPIVTAATPANTPVADQDGMLGGQPLKVEFSIENSHQYNQASSSRWLISHLLRSKWAIVSIFVNALGNAAGAFATPILIGAAFNAYLSPERDLSKIALYALLIPVAQLFRAVVLTLRNMSSELVGERLERNVRDELYVSLLSKSMAEIQTSSRPLAEQSQSSLKDAIAQR